MTWRIQRATEKATLSKVMTLTALMTYINALTQVMLSWKHRLVRHGTLISAVKYGLRWICKQIQRLTLTRVQKDLKYKKHDSQHAGKTNWKLRAFVL